MSTACSSPFYCRIFFLSGGRAAAVRRGPERPEDRISEAHHPSIPSSHPFGPFPALIVSQSFRLSADTTTIITAYDVFLFL
jgi:hypothetical protein